MSETVYRKVLRELVATIIGEGITANQDVWDAVGKAERALNGEPCAHERWVVEVVRDEAGHWQADALKDRLIECASCSIPASEVKA